MRVCLLLSFLLVSSVFASVNQKLPNNHLSYYSAEFYQNYPQAITKDFLFEILDGSHRNGTDGYDDISHECSKGSCYSHEVLGYSGARKVLFGKLFIEKDQSGTFVQDVYCGKKFYFRDVNEALRMHDQVNTEHTWPQSKFSSAFNKDMQKSDLHHLYPTDSKANSQRGNYRFGDVSASEDELSVEDCAGSRLAKHRDIHFAPPVEHRGNVARSMFYFSTRYKMQISAVEEIILRQWHILDPVDREEIDHHEIIAQFQKVRNPYIDFPELVNVIKDF
jgi:deoxyribonuclease-1